METHEFSKNSYISQKKFFHLYEVVFQVIRKRNISLKTAMETDFSHLQVTWST